MGHISPTLLEGVHVLVVDDNLDALAILRAVLDHHGAAVVTAATATEALEYLRNVRPDVIVSDLSMPGITGFGLVNQLRRHVDPVDRPIPAIAFSAFADAANRRKALADGFDLFLAKPVDPVVVVEAIARLAGRQP